MKKIIITLALALMMCQMMQAAPLKGKVLYLDFSQPVSERSKSSFNVGLSGVGSSKSTSLLTYEAVLASAAKDDGIAMIYMRPDHLSAGTATREELRTSIMRFRENSGKRVVAYLESISAGSLYIASAADMVILNPAGSGSFTGMGSTQYFLKDFLDALGVKMQLIRHGKYKSAGEMYIRNDISPENREQYEALLGSIWNSYMTEIAASRGTTVEHLNSLAENLVLGDAPTWYQEGLVDTLMHRDQVEAYLCSLFGKEKSSDISRVTVGKYKLNKSHARDKVAIIYADGEIGSGSEIVGQQLARTIEEVMRDDKVKAVVFRVNSPGGAVFDSDLIRRAILQLQAVKPVIASYGNYAASGGYWISSSAKRIFCSNATLTGSIGVFGMVPSYGGAIRKILRVNPVTVGTHSHSDMGTGMRDLDEAELEWNQKQIETVYTNFINLVAENRGMTPEAVDEIAQGRVWAGVTAFEIGLADERGTLLDAVKYAAKDAGLTNFRVETYPEVKEMDLKSFLKGGNGEDLPLVFTEYQGLIGLLQSVDEPSVMALMECVIDIR